MGGPHTAGSDGGGFWRGSRRMGGASRSISGVEQTLAGPSNGGSSYICLGKTA